MVAITAAVFYFAAIMPAFNYYYTEAQASAGFGSVATLPWPSDSSAAALESLVASGRDCAVIWDVGTATVSGAGIAAAGVECKTLDPVSNDPRTLTYYSERLMASQWSTVHGIGAVLDSSLARRVDARVGDRVRVTLEARGTQVPAPFSAGVVGLVRPTNETSGILLVGMQPSVPRLAAQVFLPGRDEGEGLASAPLGAGVDVTQRDEALSGGRARLEQVLSRNTRYVLIWVSLAVYAGYQLWDHLDRLKDRRRRHAILISLGLEERVIVGELRREQLVVASVTAPLGCALGLWVFTSASNLYLPPDSLAACVGYAFVVNVTVAVVAGWHFRREVRRLPVATLLSGS
jgi:hypothetical protein